MSSADDHGEATPGVALTDDTRTLLAVLLAMSAMALEQVQRVGLPGSGSLLIGQVIQWLSDSLLTFVLATLAVWAACRLAPRLGLAQRGATNAVGFAALISLLFAAALVPGAALVEGIRRLLENGSLDAPYVPMGVPGMSPLARNLPPIVLDGLQAFGDALVAQLLAFPVAALTLLAAAYRSRVSPRLAGARSVPLRGTGLVASVGMLVGLLAIVYVSLTGSLQAQSANTAVPANDVHMSLFGEFNADPLPLHLLANRPVKLFVDNSTQLEHEVVIPDLHVDLRVGPGESTFANIPATPIGMYHWQCVIPGHQAVGMDGWIVFGSTSPSDHALPSNQLAHD